MSSVSSGDRLVFYFSGNATQVYTPTGEMAGDVLIESKFIYYKLRMFQKLTAIQRCSPPTIKNQAIFMNMYVHISSFPAMAYRRVLLLKEINEALVIPIQDIDCKLTVRLANMMSSRSTQSDD